MAINPALFNKPPIGKTPINSPAVPSQGPATQAPATQSLFPQAANGLTPQAADTFQTNAAAPPVADPAAANAATPPITDPTAATPPVTDPTAAADPAAAAENGTVPATVQAPGNTVPATVGPPQDGVTFTVTEVDANFQDTGKVVGEVKDANGNGMLDQEDFVAHDQANGTDLAQQYGNSSKYTDLDGQQGLTAQELAAQDGQGKLAQTIEEIQANFDKIAQTVDPTKFQLPENFSPDDVLNNIINPFNEKNGIQPPAAANPDLAPINAVLDDPNADLDTIKTQLPGLIGNLDQATQDQINTILNDPAITPEDAKAQIKAAIAAAQPEVNPAVPGAADPAAAAPGLNNTIPDPNAAAPAVPPINPADPTATNPAVPPVNPADPAAADPAATDPQVAQLMTNFLKNLFS